MPKRSLFNQLNQVRGTVDFKDDEMVRALAETCGRDYLTGTLAVVSGSNIVTDSSNAFEKSEQNNFIVIDSGDAAGTYTVTSGSGAFTAAVTPTPTASDTVAYKRHYYQNLEDDLNYLRKMFDLVIGEDKWYDEPDTDLKNMAYLIPKRPNYIGETGQYADRPGTVSFSISDINQTGYVSSGAPAGEYTAEGSSSASAGDSMQFTDDNSMAIAITGGFYPADSGVIRIYSDGIVVGELDLAAAWTSDGCSYEEEEADVGDNPGYTASNTGTDIINLTNRRCMNTTVDSYPSFWPPYQIASMSATLTLPAGYQGQIYVAHTGGGSNQNYTYSEFWVDTTAQTISAAAPTVSPLSATTKYLSGIPYYTTNSTFTVSGTNSNTLFDRGYITNPMTLNLEQFNETSVTPSLAQIGFSTPLAITDTIAGEDGYAATATVGGGNYRDMDVRATATYRNPFTSATSTNSTAGTYRIDTYGNTSTDTSEPFDDEQYRMLGDEDFTDTGVDEGDSNWDSSDDVTTISGAYDGLVVYNGTLKYPTVNHSTGYYPVGPDYSGASGNFYYYRVFLATAAFTSGTITFSGWSNAVSTIQGANVEVHLRYPNCTDYGNSNTNVWQDLGVDQTTFGGNGCLGSGSSGSSVAFSFGTTSSVSYGNRIIMRIKYSANVTALAGITFSPTL